MNIYNLKTNNEHVFVVDAPGGRKELLVVGKGERLDDHLVDF